MRAVRHRGCSERATSRPGPGGQHRRHSDSGASCPVHLVDPEAIGPDLESPRRSGQPHGPPDKIARRPVELVDPTGPRIWPRVARERRSTPPALGHWPESSWTTCRHPGPTEPCANHRERWSNLWAIGPEASRPGEMFDTAGPQIQARVAGTVGGLRRDSEQGSSRPQVRFDTAAPWTWVRDFLDSWSTPQELGAEPMSPGIFGRSRATWDTGTCHPQQLVHSAGLRNRARVARDIWSTSWTLVP